MPKVSAVIITFNEEASIRKTLSQLWWCDEILIVDSYSQDATIAICEKYSCRIIQRKFNGYGEQKRFAVNAAVNDWVLCLDADEWLTDALVEEILLAMKNPGNTCGFKIPMNLIFRGHEFKHGKESRRYFTRLFNRTKGYVSKDKLHEQIVVNGPIKKFKARILHNSYNNTEHYFNKFNIYTSAGAMCSYKKQKIRSQVLIVFAIPIYFIKYYLLEKNFLNGINGFYWALFSSFSHFVKYIKIRDLHDCLSEVATVNPDLKIGNYKFNRQLNEGFSIEPAVLFKATPSHD
jgi:glycosyltransferase involved in cell wall biosynthesis